MILNIDVRARSLKLNDVYAELKREFPSVKLRLTGGARECAVDVYSVDAREVAQAVSARVYAIVLKHEPKEVQECFAFFH